MGVAWDGKIILEVVVQHWDTPSDDKCAKYYHPSHMSSVLIW